MTDDVILKSSRTKYLVMLPGAVLFVVGGFFMARDATDSVQIWLSWGCVGFFGLCAALFAVRLLPGASYLKIGPLGIEWCMLWRKHSTAWSGIQEFGVAQIDIPLGIIPNRRRKIGLTLLPDRIEYEKHQWLKTIGKALVGFDDVLPDNYGMKPEELVVLLEEKRRQY